MNGQKNEKDHSCTNWPPVPLRIMAQELRDGWQPAQPEKEVGQTR